MQKDDDIFARPPRRSVPPPAPKTCAVCGLRSHGLVCAMCLDTPAASIAWLDKLPTLSRVEQQALAELRARIAPAAPEAFPFDNPIVVAYWRDEIARDCAVALKRLRTICDQRGADYDRTLEGLR